MKQIKTVGYKAMSPDMTCRDYQFAVGKTYSVDNDKPLALCSESGFHFCLNLEDVFLYYDYWNCRVFEVETTSEVLTKDEKSITKTLKISREITKDELAQYPFKQLKHQIYFNIDDVSEQELVEKYAQHDDWEVRLALAYSLTDKQLIKDNLSDDEDSDVLITVMNKIIDEQWLVNKFANHKHWRVRRALVNILTNEQLIKDNLGSDKDIDVLIEAIHKITDEQWLVDKFATHVHWRVRQALVYRLTDEQLIKVVADYLANDEVSDVLIAVNKRLKELSHLKK